MEFGGLEGKKNPKKNFLEGSVDHVIYRDYTVNRRFFIYCSPACFQPLASEEMASFVDLWEGQRYLWDPADKD